MIVAQQKRKENIVEYILYMWQIEDIIRAHNFDMTQIQQNLIQQYDQPDEIRQQLYEWYESLAEQMKEEGIEKQGHMAVYQTLIDDLFELHQKLLQNTDELAYIEAYKKAQPALSDLVQKSKGSVKHEIEAAFTGLYGLLLLRLRGQEIKLATAEAIADIAQMMARLSQRFHQVEKGELDLE
ncbi:MAG: DUF4924 family protein [Bacteroidota bacterium]